MFDCLMVRWKRGGGTQLVRRGWGGGLDGEGERVGQWGCCSNGV